jgi:hypothetical protein
MTEFGEHVQTEQSTGQALGLPPSESALPTRGINTPLASLMSLAELLPINFATLGAVQAAYGNRVITAACFTAVTLATEASGAIGSADLIERKNVNRPIQWAHQKLLKLNVDKENTSVPTDLAVTVAAGTVALNVFKQIQDPKRERLRNRRYGLLMGIGNSAVSGAGVWLALEGMYHPNPEDITFGSLAVLSLLGIRRIVKNKFKKTNDDSVAIK